MPRRQDVFAAIRARVLVAWPGSVDVGDDAHPVAAARLPAFALTLNQLFREPAAMSAGGSYRVQDRVLVAGWRPGGASAPPLTRQGLLSLADALVVTMLAPPAYLGGLVIRADPATTSVEIQKGEAPVGYIEVGFDVEYFETPPIHLVFGP